MSKSFIVVGSNGTVAASVTRYGAISGAGRPSTTSFRTTEAEAEIPVRNAGVASGLYVSMTGTASVSTVVTLRKSRADTALTITYSAGQSGIKEDTSNTVSFAATDEIDYKVVTGANSASMVFGSMGITFDPTVSTDCVSFPAVSGTTTFNTASTFYNLVPGRIGGSGGVLYDTLLDFTSSNFYTYVSSNARTTNCVLTVEKNGAAGNQTVTYTSGQTGAKEDTVNTDSFTIGDDFAYGLDVSTGTGNMVLHIVTSNIVNTSNQFLLVSAGGVNHTAAAGASPTYSIAGDLSLTTTESFAKARAQFDLDLQDFNAYVATNTLSGSSTATVRKNVADTALVLTYTTGQTGLKSDTSNTASYTGATDYSSFRITAASGTGSIEYIYLGVIGSTSAASTLVKDFIGGFIPFAR